MFAMSPHTYVYAAQAAPPPARTYSHGTSSAFSPSANPDEDWTKISDLAERRRIQNRIAQRNYRKKLKRRLEDLERRAGTSDGASSSGNEKTSPTPKPSKRVSVPKAQKQSPTPVKQMTQGQFTPPMHPADDDSYHLFASSYDERDGTHSPPPMFQNYSYPPPPEEMLPIPYGAMPSYRHDSYPQYMPAHSVAQVTLPSMTHFNDAIKREPSYPTLEDHSHYMIHNGYIPGVNMHSAHPSPYDHMPHTPPLTNSYDHSAACSDSGSYEYPTTPLSMPDSPLGHQ